jgi:bacterioferritin-associated ferredoxin
MRDLARELGVGACCGKCLPEARKVLSNSIASNAVSSSPMLIPALG